MRWKPASMHHSKPSSSSGFTLLEIMLVLMIIVLVATASVPMFAGTLRAAQFDSTISEFRTFLQSARNQAIITRQKLVLNFDFQRQSFTVSALRVETAPEPAPSGSGVIPSAQEIKEPEPATAAIHINPFELPEEIEIKQIQLANKKIISRGQIELLVFPNGRFDEAVFEFVQDQKARKLVLVDALTGQTKIVE